VWQILNKEPSDLVRHQ